MSNWEALSCLKGLTRARPEVCPKQRVNIIRILGGSGYHPAASSLLDFSGQLLLKYQQDSE